MQALVAGVVVVQEVVPSVEAEQVPVCPIVSQVKPLGHCAALSQATCFRWHDLVSLTTVVHTGSDVVLGVEDTVAAPPSTGVGTLPTPPVATASSVTTPELVFPE